MKGKGLDKSPNYFRGLWNHNVSVTEFASEDGYETGEPVLNHDYSESRKWVVLGENDIKDDKKFKERCKELSGPVKVYRLEDKE